MSRQIKEGESGSIPEVKQDPTRSTFGMILENSDQRSSTNVEEEVVEAVVRRHSILNLEMGTLAAIYEENLDD